MTTIREIKRYHGNHICDAPECHRPVIWTVRFDDHETPGLDSLDVCDPHREEIETNYARDAARERTTA